MASLLRAVLRRLRDEANPSDSALCSLLSALLQLLTPQPAFPTVLCSALSSQLGGQFVSSLRDRLQSEHRLQLITSLSILEAAPDDDLAVSGHLMSPRGSALWCVSLDNTARTLKSCRFTDRRHVAAGREWLSQALEQPWAADAVAGLPRQLLHRVVAVLAADPATFGAQLQRLAADLDTSQLEPSLLALLPPSAQQDSSQQVLQAAAGAAGTAAAAAAMAGETPSGSAPSGSLAPLLEQLGYAATASDAAAAKLVAVAGELSPRSVGAALGLMARTREGLAPGREDAPAGLALALSGLSLEGSQTSGWQVSVVSNLGMQSLLTA